MTARWSGVYPSSSFLQAIGTIEIQELAASSLVEEVGLSCEDLLDAVEGGAVGEGGVQGEGGRLLGGHAGDEEKEKENEKMTEKEKETAFKRSAGEAAPGRR
jgi:hypothetical protein